MAPLTDSPGIDLLASVGNQRFATILADPPWQFTNKTGKIAPEHRRLARYQTLTLPEIMELPVATLARGTRKGWAMWGNQADENYRPTWNTYAHHSMVVAAR